MATNLERRLAALEATTTPEGADPVRVICFVPVGTPRPEMHRAQIRGEQMLRLADETEDEFLARVKARTKELDPPEPGRIAIAMAYARED